VAQEEEIKRQKGEEVEVEAEPEIKLPVSAFLPEDYVPDQKQRLAWYKRLARARSVPEITSLREELIDRYGALPGPAEDLLAVTRLKTMLYKLRATELSYNGTEIILALRDDTTVELERILALAAGDPRNYRLAPDNRLCRRFAAREPRELFPAIAALLNELAGDAKMP
jgi:transcription-repair coupling factor (superfamily II helicase)